MNHNQCLVHSLILVSPDNIVLLTPLQWSVISSVIFFSKLIAPFQPSFSLFLFISYLSSSLYRYGHYHHHPIWRVGRPKFDVSSFKALPRVPRSLAFPSPLGMAHSPTPSAPPRRCRWRHSGASERARMSRPPFSLPLSLPRWWPGGNGG